jgi:hypothetical protein
MSVENKEDFVKWTGVTTKIESLACLGKSPSIQADLDTLDHVRVFRQNIKTVCQQYNKANKAYLASIKTEVKTDLKAENITSMPDFLTMSPAQIKAWQKALSQKKV